MTDTSSLALAARNRKKKKAIKPCIGFELDFYGDKATYVVYALSIKDVKSYRKRIAEILDKYKINKKPAISKTDKSGLLITQESFNSHVEGSEANAQIADVYREIVAKCVYIRIPQEQLIETIKSDGGVVPDDLPEYEEAPAFRDEKDVLDSEAINDNKLAYDDLLPEVLVFTGLVPRSRKEQKEVDEDPDAPKRINLNPSS